jgi:hypothetical protein
MNTYGISLIFIDSTMWEYMTTDSWTLTEYMMSGNNVPNWKLI